MKDSNTKASKLKEIREKNDYDYITRSFEKGLTDETIENYYKNILTDEQIQIEIEKYGEEIENVLKEFNTRTKLNKVDMEFLIFAIMLQCVRIYGINPLINKMTEVEKANTHGGKEDFFHKKQEEIFSKFKKDEAITVDKLYASKEFILTNRGVPYDATRYENENLKIFKGVNHRFATLGHDPILGLIFGTANILTNTISCTSNKKVIKTISTYTVVYDELFKNPQISTQTSTLLMLKSAFSRIENDNEAVIAAIIKQFIHIMTDVYTPKSIPFPFVNFVFTNENTEKITQYINSGDLIKYGTSSVISIFINTIISTLHACKLFFDKDSEEDKTLYEVRTRKILLYSNLIASSSNVIQSALTNGKNIDIGGLIVTCYRVFSDTNFINKVKYEFLNAEISDRYKLID